MEIKGWKYLRAEMLLECSWLGKELEAWQPNWDVAQQPATLATMWIIYSQPHQTPMGHWLRDSRNGQLDSHGPLGLKQHISVSMNNTNSLSFLGKTQASLSVNHQVPTSMHLQASAKNPLFSLFPWSITTSSTTQQIEHQYELEMLNLATGCDPPHNV